MKAVCEYCLRRAGRALFVCAPCGASLCVECFCYGAEGGGHIRSHDYRVKLTEKKDKSKNNSLKLKWSCEEELELLSAVGVYKCGNWTDIASMVQTKSSDECRQYFLINFVEGEYSADIINVFQRPPGVKKLSVIDHTEGISSPIFYEKYSSSLLKQDEIKFLGYLPRRNEFMMEYEDSAEGLICELDSDKSVDSLLSAIQISLINMYNRRITKRNWCKKIIMEHGLTYHLIAKILDKGARDYNYFHRQMLKVVQPSSSHSTIKTSHSIFGRNYVHRRRSFTSSLAGYSDPSSTPSTENGIPSFTPTSSTSQTFFTQEDNDKPFYHYNASLIDDKLKPFIRYLSSEQTKDFLDSLKKEETLKREILSLETCVSLKIKDFNDFKGQLSPLNAPETITHKRKPRRRRGIQSCFQFVYLMRKKRMDKYLESLKTCSP